MIRERNYSLDIIRIIACIMVVLMHSPLPSPNASGIVATTISYFTTPCIGLFFMTSGTLLLPVKDNLSKFLKKRLNKVIYPTVIWSIVYMLLSYSSLSDVHIDFSIDNLLHSLLSIPFSAQGHGVMWFMYTIIGLYLLAPIISRWLDKASRKEIEFYLFVCGVTFLYPYISLILSVNESNTGILYYFSGYVGYFILGYYLIKYPESIKMKYPFVISIFGIFGLAYCKLRHVEIDFYSLFWYLSAPVAAMCVVWFIGCQKLKGHISSLSVKTKNIIVKFSNISFGIYLCHIAIMRYGVWHFSFIKNINNYMLQTILIFLLTLSLSICFLLVIAKTPLGKYVIGYSEKNYNPALKAKI